MYNKNINTKFPGEGFICVYSSVTQLKALQLGFVFYLLGICVKEMGRRWFR